MCFCCGAKNPIGLKLEFHETSNGRMATVWTPRKEHQGFKDIVHGGLVATVLDEVMVRLLYLRGIEAVTAGMETKLIQPVMWGKPYRFEGWIVQDRGRAVITEAEAFEESTGKRVAWCKATCIRVDAKRSGPAGRNPDKRAAARGKGATSLPESMMTGKVSTAKAAIGDEPVSAYIASLPQPQRAIAESVDALAAKTLPGLQRSVKWGMSYYGVGDGWCFCCGGFAGHVKLMFVNGAALKPVPPVTPVAMGKSTRGVELRSVNDLDERQIAAWMKQVAAVPGVGGKKR